MSFDVYALIKPFLITRQCPIPEKKVNVFLHPQYRPLSKNIPQALGALSGVFYATEGKTNER